MSDTQARLDAYKAAEIAVLKGQTIRFGERQLDLADLAEIRKAIKDLTQQVQAESGLPSSGSSLRFKTAVFCGK